MPGWINVLKAQSSVALCQAKSSPGSVVGLIPFTILPDEGEDGMRKGQSPVALWLPPGRVQHH